MVSRSERFLNVKQLVILRLSVSVVETVRQFVPRLLNLSLDLPEDHFPIGLYPNLARGLNEVRLSGNGFTVCDQSVANIHFFFLICSSQFLFLRFRSPVMSYISGSKILRDIFFTFKWPILLFSSGFLGNRVSDRYDITDRMICFYV